MAINFRTHEINQSTHKLIQTPILIKKHKIHLKNQTYTNPKATIYLKKKTNQTSDESISTTSRLEDTLCITSKFMPSSTTCRFTCISVNSLQLCTLAQLSLCEPRQQTQSTATELFSSDGRCHAEKQEEELSNGFQS